MAKPEIRIMAGEESAATTYRQVTFGIKNGVFWDVTPCDSCKYLPEDAILHSHRRENLKSYIA
jgi:hypothetical protein